MNKTKKNNHFAIWDKKVFFKTILLTTIAIVIVLIGFVAAGVFAGELG